MHTKNTSSALLCLTLLLASCGSTETPAEEAESLTGSQGIAGVVAVSQTETKRSRPTAMLGVFVVEHLEKLQEIPAESAMRGVGALSKLFEEQSVDTDETYTLLQELGNVLQVKVPEMLNNSPKRPEALNLYGESLKNVAQRSILKRDELKSYLESTREKQREQQGIVTQIEREIDKAIREEDYGTAGSQQQRLQTERAKLTEIQSDRERTEDILKSFEKLLEIAERRAIAIEENREALIAGVTVVDIPGIEELDLIEESKRSRDAPSPFGEN